MKAAITWDGEEKARMRLYEKKAACCGCRACGEACPVGAINMVSDEEGFWYPEIDEKKCINCAKSWKAPALRISLRLRLGAAIL